jgi:hypothetical protein
MLELLPEPPIRPVLDLHPAALARPVALRPLLGHHPFDVSGASSCVFKRESITQPRRPTASLPRRVEAVCPVPVPEVCGRVVRDDHARLDATELSRPARQRDDAGKRRKRERDMAERAVSRPGVKNDVGVVTGGTRRVRVNDLRADVDRLQVGRSDRAERTGLAGDCEHSIRWRAPLRGELSVRPATASAETAVMPAASMRTAISPAKRLRISCLRLRTLPSLDARGPTDRGGAFRRVSFLGPKAGPGPGWPVPGRVSPRLGGQASTAPKEVPVDAEGGVGSAR